MVLFPALDRYFQNFCCLIGSSTHDVCFQQATQRIDVIGNKSQCLCISIQRSIVSTRLLKTIGSLHERSSSLGPHTLFQVAVSKLEADFGVIRIEVGDLMKDVEGPFVVTRTSVRVGYDQILGTRVNNQSLTRVEFA